MCRSYFKKINAILQATMKEQKAITPHSLFDPVTIFPSDIFLLTIGIKIGIPVGLNISANKCIPMPILTPVKIPRIALFIIVTFVNNRSFQKINPITATQKIGA